MSLPITDIVTPNGVKHRMIDKEDWYIEVLNDTGKGWVETQKLPRLLSIFSTDDSNPIFMDEYQVLKCYDLSQFSNDAIRVYENGKTKAPINYNDYQDKDIFHCHLLPIGTYYIGDPGYVMPEQDYATFLETYFASKESSGFFKFEDKKILIIDNMGDGFIPIYDDSYPDKKWSSLPIDHGMFAFIPFDYLTQECGLTKEFLLEKGCVMTFNYEGIDWGDDDDKPSDKELETYEVYLWDYTMCEVDGYTFFMDSDAEDAYNAIGKETIGIKFVHAMNTTDCNTILVETVKDEE